MSIRDKALFMAKLWDWSFLDRCFSNGIKITDMDGLVERHGKFLMLETKSYSTDVPTGQARCFDSIIKDERWTVLVVWGDPNKPLYAQFWGGPVFPATEQTIIDAVNLWWTYANRYTQGRFDVKVATETIDNASQIV